MTETLLQIAALVVPMIIAIVFHEVAHGWVARALGDPTASALGRLSLNPLKHVDPFGTIILPGALKLAGLPVLGWAKPVPVDKARLRNPRRDMMLVAAAGPGINFVMAAMGAVVLGLLIGVYKTDPEPGAVALFFFENLQNFLVINLFLALFNLLPIPPFDGSHIVEGMLPAPAARAYERIRPIGFPLIIALVVVLPWLIPSFNPVQSVLMPPMAWLYSHYYALVTAVAGV